MCRELTRDERKGIRKLVTEMCANYDREYGCLPLDCECYMLGKCWTEAYCRYFREAVLPLDSVLMVSICEDGPAPAVRRLRKALSSGGAASLLFRRLQGRGKPQKEPGAHEKKAAEKRIDLLRFARRKSPVFRDFFRLFPGPEYLNTFRPGLTGYFVTFMHFGPTWPEAGKEETT